MNVLVSSASLNQYEWHRQVAEIEHYLSMAEENEIEIFREALCLIPTDPVFSLWVKTSYLYEKSFSCLF